MSHSIAAGIQTVPREHSSRGSSTLSGGSGIDTLHLDFVPGGIYTLSGRPAGVGSIERLDIEDGAAQDWTWSFRAVRDISSTDALRIEGVTAYAGGESWTHYDYVLNGIVQASVSIDTDVNVYLI